MEAEPAPAPTVLTVDVEDWFHAPQHPLSGLPESWSNLPSVLDLGLARSLAIMDRLRGRGTFFVLGWVAQRRPDLVRTIADAGHELGSHGWDHTRADRLGPEAAADQAARAAALLEDVAGVAVRAYRAPCWSLPADGAYYRALAARGLCLSSSTFHPRRAGLFHGVREIPALGWPLGGAALPVGGTVTLRQAPAAWTRARADRTRRAGLPAIFWFHPWELVPEAPRVRGGAFFGWARHAGLERLPQQFGRIVGPGSTTLSEAARTLEGTAGVR